MIRVELHPPVARYECVATVTVEGDGTYAFDDPDARFATYLHVLFLHENGEPGFDKVTFEEDPATRARNLHTVLRTGYLVPVVVRDDDAGVGIER